MSLRHGLLGLLAERPRQRLRPSQGLRPSLAFIWPATQSQLYGELNRLADDGLIDVTQEGPRGRKDYAITDNGRAELEHWITDVEPDRVRRNEAMLRVFFLGTVGPVHAKAYLEREADRARGPRAAPRRHRSRHRLGHQRLQPLRPPGHRERTPIRARSGDMGSVGPQPRSTSSTALAEFHGEPQAVVCFGELAIRGVVLPGCEVVGGPVADHRRGQRVAEQVALRVVAAERRAASRAGSASRAPRRPPTARACARAG